MYHGWCPEKLVVRYWKKTIPLPENPLGPDSIHLEQVTTDITLFAEDGEAKWFQHQSFASERSDIVVIPLGLPAKDEPSIYCLNDYGFAQLFHVVGCDVFVVGYPLKRVFGDNSMSLPVWKRGSVASEILIAWKQKYSSFPN